MTHNAAAEDGPGVGTSALSCSHFLYDCYATGAANGGLVFTLRNLRV